MLQLTAAQRAEALKVAEGELELSTELFEVLYPQMEMEMPYGTAKARDGDPFDWICDHLEEYLHEA